MSTEKIAKSREQLNVKIKQHEFTSLLTDLDAV